jgi:hypothetical protein
MKLYNTIPILMLCLALSSSMYARQRDRSNSYDTHRRHRTHHYHEDPYRGERMTKGFFGGATTGAVIGGLAGGGRGAGIGFGVGALTGIMAGAAASESHKYDYDDYEPYYEEPEYDQDAQYNGTEDNEPMPPSESENQ